MTADANIAHFLADSFWHTAFPFLLACLWFKAKIGAFLSWPALGKAFIYAWLVTGLATVLIVFSGQDVFGSNLVHSWQRGNIVSFAFHLSVCFLVLSRSQRCSRYIHCRTGSRCAYLAGKFRTSADKIKLGLKGLTDRTRVEITLAE